MTRRLFALLGSLLLAFALVTVGCTGGSDDSETEGVPAGDGVETPAAADPTEGASTPEPTEEASETGGESDFAPALALQRTAEVPRYSFAMSMSFEDIPDLPSGATMTMEGAVDGPGQAFRMSMDMSAFMEAMAALEGDDAGLEEFQQLFGDAIEFVVVDDTLYLRWPLFTLMFGATTPWVSIPAEDMGMDFASNMGFGDVADASAYLAFLQDAQDFEVVGTEEVRGATTTHYRANIDLAAAATAFSAGGMSAVDPSELALLEAMGPLPLETWIDGDNRIRKVAMSMDFEQAMAADPTASGEFPGRMSIVIEYFDFDEPVSIQAPAASEVTELDAEAAGMFGAMSGGTPDLNY